MDPSSCYCSQLRTLGCSWTSSNPGRRFYGCGQYGTVGGCNYFLWFDPPMCERSRQVIPGLLRSIDQTESQLHQVQAELRTVKTELQRVDQRGKRIQKVFLVAFLFLLLIFKNGKSNIENTNVGEVKQLL
ncbi:hypothetical protein BUALT_Bualt02G0097100 [Buddleja alternifolia]|uniref:GRF-type domain-containing protein n=1 Tax=Buddleja alternifolia TaxID=168488 RepID=A0AAV6XYZ5_9LAMI|nr:hypothetical protein BUALT_Bualt02G0097100 [Buddleja alternifolia]